MLVNPVALSITAALSALLDELEPPTVFLASDTGEEFQEELDVA